MRRRVPVLAAIIHMNVDVCADPAAGPGHGPCSLIDVDRQFGRLRGGDDHVSPLELALEPMPDFNGHGSARDIDPFLPAHMEIMCFGRPLPPIETVIRMNPRARRSIEPPRSVEDADARGRRSSLRVVHLDMKVSHRRTELPNTNLQGLNIAAGHTDDIYSRISRLIRNKGDARAVRRPARVGLIPIAVGQGKCIPAARRHQPQVVPRSSEVGAEHQS